MSSLSRLDNNSFEIARIMFEDAKNKIKSLIYNFLYF